MGRSIAAIALVAVGMALVDISGWSDGPAEAVGASVRPAPIERGIRGCANRNRTAVGLPRLSPSRALARAARMQARSMARNDYFDHTDPQGRSVGDRVRIFDRGSRFTYVGENIAAGYGSAASACRGWMASPGHRENILRRAYTHIGGGFARGGSLGRYYVQVFAALEPAQIGR